MVADSTPPSYPVDRHEDSHGGPHDPRDPHHGDPRDPHAPDPRDPNQSARRFSRSLGDGALPWGAAVTNEVVRRWDVVTPSATLIGRPDHPDADVSETVRRLHDEQHPAMAGHAERMHRLDKARITHALCSRLGVTPWERDRALAIMLDLDLRAFGSQRGVPTVALVAIRYVVDQERRHRLGLHEGADLGGLSPDRMADLYDRFTSLTDEERYRELLAEQDLDVTSVNRLTRTLETQVAGTRLEDAALGRSPYRDPAMPAIPE